MPISSRKITAFTNLIASLADKPNATLSAAQLKAKFDSSPEELRVALNGLIDDMLATVAGSSGANNIGVTAITDLTGANVQTVLESLRNTLKSIVDGTSGADFVNSTAITGVTGTTVQSQLESIKTLIDAIYTKAQLDAGQLDNRYFTETELQSTTTSTSGANKIGSATISGVTGATVYDQLVNLKSQISDVVLGQIPDGTLTEAKLSFAVATQAELDVVKYRSYMGV